MPFLFVPQKIQIITREPTDIAIEPLRLDRFEGRALQNHG